MPAKYTHAASLGGGLRRGSAIVLMTVVALYSLDAAPANAGLLRETMPPALRQHVPGIQPGPQQLAELTDAVKRVGDAIGGRKSGKDAREKKIAKLKKEEKKLQKKYQKLREKEEKLNKNLERLGKKFLESKADKDTREALNKARKKREKKLVASQDKYKKVAKKANENRACCIVTPEEQSNAKERMMLEHGRANREFDEAKRKIVAAGLAKSDQKNTRNTRGRWTS